MSDRTQLAIGRNAILVPRLTKRFVEAILSTALTSLVAFVVLLLNNVLTNRGGWIDGFYVWQSLMRQPAILGTMLLTSLVTVLFLSWQRDRETKR
jgi:Zn-dependent protease with chaperone function